MNGPLKWHGGKAYLADWIISLMPPRCKTPNKPDDDDPGWLHYVEPYFGGGSVLLANDPDGISEVVNDKNRELTHFWWTLREDGDFAKFSRAIQTMPFSQIEYELAIKTPISRDDSSASSRLDRALRFYVLCRQSMAGRMKGMPPMVKTRTRRGMQDHVSAWLSAVDGLPEVHERLRRIAILDQDATTVIKKQDGSRTLFYLDPPYLHETRTTTNEYGENEMSVGDHFALLAALSKIKGRFLLSGYHSAMYDAHATENGWTCHEKEIDNKAAGGKTKRTMTECVWCNFAPVPA